MMMIVIIMIIMILVVAMQCNGCGYYRYGNSNENYDTENAMGMVSRRRGCSRKVEA